MYYLTARLTQRPEQEKALKDRVQSSRHKAGNDVIGRERRTGLQERERGRKTAQAEIDLTPGCTLSLTDMLPAYTTRAAQRIPGHQSVQQHARPCSEHSRLCSSSADSPIAILPRPPWLSMIIELKPETVETGQKQNEGLDELFPGHPLAPGKEVS